MLEHSPESAMRAAGGEVEFFHPANGPDDARSREDKPGRPLMFLSLIHI